MRRIGNGLYLTAAAAVMACMSITATAAPIYWDTNGSTAGAGSPANGTWNTTATNWSLSSAGDIDTISYDTTYNLYTTDVTFSAGTDAASAAITMGADMTAGSLTFATGTTSFTGTQKINVGSGGITVQAGAGTVAIGNAGGSTSVYSRYNQTWTNNGSGSLIVGGGSFFGGTVVTLAAGTIQLGNDGTNNSFASSSGVGTFLVDGATAVWSLSSTGIASNNLEFKSGTFQNKSGKGLGKGFKIDGNFNLTGSGNAWRDITINGTSGLNPILSVNTTTATSFTGYTLIGTAANQNLTLSAAAGRTVNVGFLNGANTPGVILDGAGTYVLVNGTSTMSGDMTLRNGTMSFGNGSTITGGVQTSGAAGVGTLKLAGGTLQATVAATLSNAVSIDGDVTFAGTNTLTFDTVTGLNTAKSITLTGNRTLTVNSGAKPVFAGGIVESSAGLGLTKAGAGVMTLGAGESIANSYTGMTTVSAGELDLAKAAGVVSVAGDVSVANGAIIKLLSEQQIADTSTVSLAGTMNLNGFNETIGTLNLTTGATISGGGLLTADLLVIDGVNYESTKQFYTSADFSWLGDGTTLSLATVPEPLSLGILACGGATALLVRRKRIS